MRKKVILLSIIFIAHVSILAFAIELDPDKFMTTDKIKSGMKGVGKTVFSGTKVEEFPIEVISVIHNYMGPKSDVIWVLCSGDVVSETGVMQGMSGSPIYIDGKMIGAVAYTYSFSKKPIAGVTPIANMLEIMERKDTSETTDMGMINEEDMPFLFPELSDKMAIGNSGMRNFFDGGDTDSFGLQKIQNPITLSGFSQRTIEYMSPVFRKYGMTPVQGGGGSAQGDVKDVVLEPGSVIGVQFVRGDYNAYGYGTVTYIDGDKILAFGHPMRGLGPTSLPAAIGEVNMLRPSLNISSKSASPVKTLGTLTYDSQYGIMVDAKKQPEFIPMKVKIKTQGEGGEEFNFEVLKNKLFAPSLIASIAMDVVLVTTKETGEHTLKTHSEINVKGYPKIVRDNVYSGLSTDLFLSDFALPIYQIMQNRFENANIEDILLEITFENKRTNASIDSATINKSYVKPGDQVDVSVSITPYMRDTVIKNFSITVPKDMPEGRALLRVSNASVSRAWEDTRAPRKSTPVSLSHIIKQIGLEEKNNEIIVELFMPKPGMTVSGEELPALPLTALSIIGTSSQVGSSVPTLGTTFLKERIATDYVLVGGASMILTIDQNAQ